MRRYRVRREETPTVSRVRYSVRNFTGIDGFGEENELPLGTARSAANAGVLSGSVVAGPGFAAPELYAGRALPDPSAQGLHFTEAFLYPIFDLASGTRHDRILARDESTGLFYRAELDGDAEWKRSGGLSLPADVCGIPVNNAGKDKFLICRPEGNFFLFYGDSYEWRPSPRFTSICFQKGRAFAVCPDENRLYFSSVGNFTDWTPDPTNPGGAGYYAIEEDGGRAEKVAAFDGMVFLFKENAVMRLRVFSDMAEFQFSKVFETQGRIRPETVAVGESAVYFLTDDGLYAFDGYDAVKIFEGFTALLGDKSHAIGAYGGGKYYLAANLPGEGVLGDEADGLVNNALAVFDLDRDSVSIARGADVLWILPVAKGNSSAVLCGFRNARRKGKIAKIDGSGTLLGPPLAKYWATGETDLREPARNKVLRRAYVSSEYPGEAEFVLDGTSYRYALNGSPNAQQIDVNRPFRRIKAIFRSAGGKFKIRDMTLEVDLVRRYYAEGK